MSGDTLRRLTPRHMSVRQQLWNAVMEAACRRWGHNMREHGRALPHGRRDYCVRCEANRVTLTADASETWASKAEVLALEPRFAEALYEACWGEPPRQKLVRGQWPAA